MADGPALRVDRGRRPRSPPRVGRGHRASTCSSTVAGSGRSGPCATPRRRRGRWPMAPACCAAFLDGSTRLSVVEHVSGRALLDEEVRLGTATARIAVVDAAGRPLGIDKSNRIATTFDTRDDEQVDSAARRDASRSCGALQDGWGGAVPGVRHAARRGPRAGLHRPRQRRRPRLRQPAPPPPRRDPRVLPAAARAASSGVRRSTATARAAFKVDVIEADGGDARARRLRWLLPRRAALPDGRDRHARSRRTGSSRSGTAPSPAARCPAPARPEKLLEATYGPGWKVPDPAFHFTTPRTTSRRLNGWFRGTRVDRNDWDRRYSTLREKMPSRRPSPLAQYVARAGGPDSRGSSTSVPDAAPTRCGSPARGCRPSRSTTPAARPTPYAAWPRRRALDLEFGWMNLHELALGDGAGGPGRAPRRRRRRVMANHLRRRHRPARPARRWCGSRGWRCPAAAGCTPTSERPAGDGPSARGARDLAPAGARRGCRGRLARRRSGYRAQRTGRDDGQDGESGADRPVARLVAEWRK